MSSALCRCVFIAAASSSLIGCASSSPATAQNISARPTYTTLDLSAGFSGDPRVESIRAGGSDRTTLAGCSAYIHASAPDVDLNYRAGSLPLTISASSETDVVLYVNTPDGSWHCNDDGGEGTNSMITFDSPQSGNYNIWVGTYSSRSGNLPAARLYVSELGRSSGGSDVGNGGGSNGSVTMNWSASPTYGTADLSSGFSPDPYTRSLSAGGRDDAPDLGSGCSGYVNASAPDFDLNYDAGSFPLNIYAKSSTDITLLVLQPDGSWACSDDANGSNPHVSLSDPMSGNYNIWVGTYSSRSGSLPEAVLYISELSPKW